MNENKTQSIFISVVSLISRTSFNIERQFKSEIGENLKPCMPIRRGNSMRIGVTRADLKHSGKIPETREELNRSVREVRIESSNSIKSLEGMGSSSHE